MAGRVRKGLWAALGTVGLAASLVVGQPGLARAETLPDAIALAYGANPALQSQRAQLRALNETYVQAMAGFRPQVTASAEFDHTKSPSLYDVVTDTDQASLSLTQPLYTGGLVTAQVRAALGDILSSRQQLRAAEAQVLQQVITAYVDVRRDQQALAISEDNVKVLARQLDETKARFEVGQITRTDVAQAQARLAQAQAQYAAAVAQLGNSRAEYVAVVGQSPGDLAPEPPLAGLPATVDEAFEVAEHGNPGVLAADLAERAAAARVAVAKAANRPNLSLRASVGTTGVVSDPQNALYPERAGVYEESLSASAVFTQPLFTGGLNSSRIRQALENDNVQQIAIETARRQAIQAISQGWNQLLAARASGRSDAQQVEADKIAFEGARQEADAGLRTIIDLLNAEQELHQAELAVVNARHDEYVAAASVLGAMGRLEARNLAPDVRLYNPESAFSAVKARSSLPWDGAVAAVDGAGSPRVAAAPPSAPATRPAPVAPAQAGGVVMP